MMARFIALWVTILAAAAYADTLSVYPPQMQLDNARDLQRLIVVLTRENGVTIDVTRQAAIRIEPEGIAQWGESLRVIPLAEGEGKIIVEHEGRTLEAPLIVRNPTLDPPLTFRNDVEPVLMRAGCNAGACHGAASGKNGFRLSLFGYDPNLDYITLTRESRGRRLDAADPAESLMLLKPGGAVDHEGGNVMPPDGPLAAIVKRWIAEGAQNDSGDIPKLTGIEMLPPAAVIEGEGAQQRFAVIASYSDGTTRDVTDLSILSSEDPAIVEMAPDGLATLKGFGEIYLMARFGTFAVISQVIAVSPARELEWPDVAPANYIDEYIYAKLKKLRTPPAEKCSDEVFLRRVFLDITGVLPSVEEARAFLADDSPGKRSKLIDDLLERPGFSNVWAMKWAEILQVRTIANQLDPKGMHRYNDWLRHAITSNKPIDEMVRELLTAQGGNFTAPAANFYLLQTQPNLVAENVAQVFLGIRIQCAQCHNHPFERWTMEDYYSFAAFFSQIGRKRSSDPRETIVFDQRSGEVSNIKDGQVMAPKFLGGATPDVSGRDRRAVLAEWLTSPDNPWFGKNIANRVWQHFFGRGIIDPPDDVRVSNPPANAELLEVLGARLVEYKYDLRQLIRDICNSNTYQLSTQPRAPEFADPDNFAVAAVRRLPSEMLLDAVADVTETKVKFAALPLGSRAIEVANGRSGNYFLEIFGRPSRETACTCERRNEPTLAQTLHLINGDTITRAIQAGDSRLAKQVSNEQMQVAAIVEELYLAAYSRPPRPEESERIVNFVEQAGDKRQALEDAYWSVLNSKEFIFNH